MEGLFDIHCHILPGVDDGAKTIEDTMKLIQAEYESGVHSIIFTPHYRRKMFETSYEKIRDKFAEIKEILKTKYPDLRVYLGCEFYTSSQMVDLLKEGERPTMAGSRYVLTEFSEGTPFKEMRYRVTNLRSNGFKPILAHVERYECIRKNIENLEELSDIGAKIQVNAGSILGEEGFLCKLFCNKLLKYELVDFIASDAHDMKRRKPNVGACAEYVSKKYGIEYAKHIFIENPEKIVEEGKKRHANESKSNE